MIRREAVLEKLKCGPNDYPLLLSEQFPHVLENIMNLWDTPEIDPLFADLLQPHGRGGGRMDRSGFPDRVWDEILHLKLLRERTRPKG